MNAHESTAYRYICKVMSEFIGGYENSLMDYAEDEPEYKEAKEFLATPHDEMVDFMYDEVMSYADKGTNRHLKFAGAEFIKKAISKRLTAWGY